MPRGEFDLSHRAVRPHLAAPAPAPMRTIYTGHPPPAQQGAGQVRTSTGYTQGAPTPDGARLFTLAGHGWRAEAERRAAAQRRAAAAAEQQARDAAEQLGARDCADLMALLKRWAIELPRMPPVPGERRRDVRTMPMLFLAAGQLGEGWDMARVLRALHRLCAHGALEMELDRKGRCGAAIRLVGSPTVLLTPGFTGDVRFA